MMIIILIIITTIIIINKYIKIKNNNIKNNNNNNNKPITYRPTPVRCVTWPCDLHLWPWRSRHLSLIWVFDSSCSICVPSLNFVGLPVRKTLGIYCVSINQPGDLWPLNHKTVSLLVYPKVIPYTKFEHFGIIHFQVMLQTNRQTDWLENPTHADRQS